MGPTPILSHNEILLRHSNRTTRAPARLQDYWVNHAILLTSGVISSSTSNTKHTFNRYISYSDISSAHRTFVHNISHLVEPESYEQANQDPKWVEAMQAELQAREENNTWTTVFLPPDKKSIGCKWVFKIKYHSNGTVERYKARLVAKGFTQREGIDYTESFTQVAKLTIVRCLLAITIVVIGVFIKWMSKMLSFIETFLKKFTCNFHLVFVDRGSNFYADSISHYMASNKHPRVGSIHSHPQSKMLASNNQGLITPYSPRFMVTPLLPYYFMLTT
ncbi:hypothetical protein ACH5RR_022756 [Cinchona calisaya]|uniref:Reverse transcriptase Ty1/copia-type domain-containing protein n=1 Tax=Cinchona calisaya TaxID=153742 RepID=A0ABD2Z9T3_9GENT